MRDNEKATVPDNARGNGKFGKRRIALLVLIFLFALELLTYLLFADAAMLETVADYFPWKVHFREDTRFEFVCIEKQTWDSLTKGQQNTLRKTLDKYHKYVYVGMDEVPDSKKIFQETDDGKRTLLGLQDGWLLGWKMESRLPFYFSASYSDYEGNMAASFGSAGYLWVFGFWVKVWSGPRGIA